MWICRAVWHGTALDRVRIHLTPLQTLLAGHGELGRWHAWLDAQEPVLVEQASPHALVEAFTHREAVAHG